MEYVGTILLADLRKWFYNTIDEKNVSIFSDKMNKIIIVIICIVNSTWAYAQDTIQLTGRKTVQGFSYFVDENQHHIGVSKDVENGLYNLFYDKLLVGRINKLSDKECLIYYVSDSIVEAIEYRPYFKIKLKLTGQVYQITSMELYKKNIDLGFDLRSEYCYIKVYDKKHKKTTELMNMLPLRCW